MSHIQINVTAFLDSNTSLCQNNICMMFFSLSVYLSFSKKSFESFAVNSTYYSVAAFARNRKKIL